MTNKKNDKTATELLLMRTKCLPRHRSYYRHPHRSCLHVLPPASDGRRKMQGFINPTISPGGSRLLLSALGYEIWGQELYPSGIQARKLSPGRGREKLFEERRWESPRPVFSLSPGMRVWENKTGGTLVKAEALGLAGGEP